MNKEDLGRFIKQWNIASSDDGICHECSLVSSCEFRLKGKEVADDCYQVLAQYILDNVNVIHASWYKDKHTKLNRCSNCHKYATYSFANARIWEQCLSKYCPFCGALIDKELKND